MKTLSVGITGGIGSGKSEVCRVFESCGALVYHADPLARDLMVRDPSIRTRLQALFGADLYLTDGSLHRKKLAKIIFTDPDAQGKVNSIIHQRVIGHLRELIGEARRKASVPLVAVEAALIYEAKVEEMFDYIVTVESSEKTRIARVAARDASAQADVMDRMRSQMSAARKSALADFVIRNNGSMKQLEEQSRFVCRLLISIACRE